MHSKEEQDDVPDLIDYDLQETRTGTDLIDTEDSEIDDGSSPKSEEHEQDSEEEREQDLEEQDSNIRPFADDTKTLRSLNNSKSHEKMMEVAKTNTDIAFSSPAAKRSFAMAAPKTSKQTPRKRPVIMKTISCDYVISLFHNNMLIMFAACAHGESW